MTKLESISKPKKPGDISILPYRPLLYAAQSYFTSIFILAILSTVFK